MKYCTHCGKEVADGYLFCAACGEPVEEAKSDEASLTEEKKCLDGFYRFFKFERLGWRIFAIVFLICAILFGILGTMFAGFGAIDFGYDTPADEITFGTLGITYIICGLLYLSVAIFNFCMVGRVNKYMNTLYSDVCPTIIRCNSVGMIVLGAMFNTLAMIFIIINFARAKGNKELLNRIAKRQQEFKAS